MHSTAAPDHGSAPPRIVLTASRIQRMPRTSRRAFDRRPAGERPFVGSPAPAHRERGPGGEGRRRPTSGSAARPPGQTTEAIAQPRHRP